MQSADNKNVPHIIYTPSKATMMKQFAYDICAYKEKTAVSSQEVISGLASFLIFVSERMAVYLNNGHKEFLLKGYRKNRKLK